MCFSVLFFTPFCIQAERNYVEFPFWASPFKQFGLETQVYRALADYIPDPSLPNAKDYLRLRAGGSLLRFLSSPFGSINSHLVNFRDRVRY